MHSQVAGIAWISAALLLIAGLAIFLPKEHPAPVSSGENCTSDTAVLAKMEDSVYLSRRKVARTKTHYRNPSRQRESTDTAIGPLHSPYTRQPLTVELNSADTTTLQLLHGIGPAYARRIVRYRERLGGFTSKEQLLEVYGFTPELLAHIAPHITVDTQSISKIDINSIPLKQLIKHPYIEYYQARDIVNLRSRGVHFGTMDDLRAVPSMADSTLQRLLPYLVFE